MIPKTVPTNECNGDASKGASNNDRTKGNDETKSIRARSAARRQVVARVVVVADLDDVELLRERKKGGTYDDE